MWKTAHGNLPLEPLGCHLCPDCDSLGPHIIMADDRPGDGWLECIDCGAVLGFLTPQDIETDVEPKPMEPMSREMLQQIDCEVVLGALSQPVPGANTDPGKAPNVSLLSALMGWRQKT